MIFILATPRSYGHIVEAAGGEGAEGTFADRLGNHEGLNHSAIVGECHHVVIHVSRSRQPGYAEVVIATRVVHPYSTHTGRDWGLTGGRTFKKKGTVKSLSHLLRWAKTVWTQEIWLPMRSRKGDDFTVASGSWEFLHHKINQDKNPRKSFGCLINTRMLLLHFYGVVVCKVF